MTHVRACLIASLALFTFACQSSSPQEDAPAPSVDKAAQPNKIEAKSPHADPPPVADEGPEDVATGEEYPLDAIFGEGVTAKVRAESETPQRKARRAEIDKYRKYETHVVRVITQEQLAHPETLTRDEIKLALAKLGAAAREMKYDKKTPEQIAAHLRGLGAWVDVTPTKVRWGFNEEHVREMIMVEGLR